MQSTCFGAKYCTFLRRRLGLQYSRHAQHTSLLGRVHYQGYRQEFQIGGRAGNATPTLSIDINFSPRNEESTQAKEDAGKRNGTEKERNKQRVSETPNLQNKSHKDKTSESSD